jgi:hypothetical protein
MGENSCRAGKQLFTTIGTINGGQHWHGKLYPWALNINSRIVSELETLHQTHGKVFQTT